MAFYASMHTPAETWPRPRKSTVLWGRSSLRWYMAWSGFDLGTFLGTRRSSALIMPPWYTWFGRRSRWGKTRWLDFMEQFTLDLQYRKDVSNNNADALSRRPYE